MNIIKSKPSKDELPSSKEDSNRRNYLCCVYQPALRHAPFALEILIHHFRHHFLQLVALLFAERRVFFAHGYFVRIFSTISVSKPIADAVMQRPRIARYVWVAVLIAGFDS